MTSKESIGDRIARLRRAKNIPQYKLANDIGLHPSSLNQIEKGRRTPKTATVTVLARALGVSRDLLLDGPPSDPSAPHHETSPREPDKPTDLSGAIGPAIQTALRDALIDLVTAVSTALAAGPTTAAERESAGSAPPAHRNSRRRNAR